MPATSLAVEPFSGGACFINPPIWQGVIKQLVHLAQFSGGLQVVDGAIGSGKTVFAHHLDACLPDDVSCGVLALPGGLPTAQVFDCLLTSLGIDVKDGQSIGQSIISLRQYDAQLKREQLRKILIIDDAHNFDDQALAALASVFQGGTETEVGLALVFIGEPGTAQRLDALNLIDVEVRDCILPSFSLAEATELLTTEFAKTHSDQLFPFDDDLVCALWNVSDGRPGEILRLAQAAWYEVGTSKDSWFSKFPVWHMLALAALIGVLVWGLLSQYLAGSNKPTAIKEIISASSVATAETTKPAGEHESEAVVETLVEDSQSSGAPEEHSMASGDIAKKDTSGDSFSPVSEPMKLAGGADNDSDATLNISNVADTAKIEVPTSIERVIDKNAKASNQINQPQYAAEPKQPTVAAVPPKPERPALEGLTTDEASLMEMQPHGFVLQVSAAKSLEALEEFVQSQSNQSSLRIYRSIRSGKSWFVVVEGFYADKDSALAAMSNLPSSQLKAGPWPKSIAAVKLEIAAYKQQTP